MIRIGKSVDAGVVSVSDQCWTVEPLAAAKANLGAGSMLLSPGIVALCLTFLPRSATFVPLRLTTRQPNATKRRRRSGRLRATRRRRSSNAVTLGSREMLLN
jgi:hypothetical protein